MKKTIKAGPVMDSVKSIIDALFRGLDRAMNDMDKWAEKKEEKNIEEDGIKGKYLMYETNAGHIIEVQLFGIEEKPDAYIMRIRHDNDEEWRESDKFIYKKDIYKKVEQYAEDHDLADFNSEDDDDAIKEGIDVNDNVSEDVLESTKISVTLQRVSAGDEDTINLCAINATSAVKALSILDDVLGDNEFVAAITAEPVSFEITQTDDEYNVEQTETVDTSNTFEEMLKACVECHHNLQAIHWAAKGKKFNDIHSFTESLMWDTKYQMDTIAEWCVEFTKKTPNVLAYQYSPLDPSEGYDFDSAMRAAKGQLDDYIKVLECYYVNVEHDVQSVMDNWIREFKKKSNYVLDRTLMPECTTTNIPNPLC